MTFPKQCCKWHVTRYGVAMDPCGDLPSVYVAYITCEGCKRIVVQAGTDLASLTAAWDDDVDQRETPLFRRGDHE